MEKMILISVGMFLLIGAGCSTDTTTARQTVEVPSVSNAQSATGLEVSAEADSAEDALVLEIDKLEGSTDEVESVPLAVLVEAGNFFFEGDAITAQPGQEVLVTFSNVDGGHTFVIDELNIRQVMTEGGVVNFTAPLTPGVYPYYCDVGGHRKLGMEGKLIVGE